MFETLIANLLCAAAAATMPFAAAGTEVVCVSEQYASSVGMEHAAGWYNGDTDTAYVIDDLDFGYTQEVLAHEFAHAWDLKKGTKLNGYPSFFSETHTGFDVEEFARLQTLHLRVWPANEVYPDVIPTSSEWGAMDRAGWLWNPDA